MELKCDLSVYQDLAFPRRHFFVAASALRASREIVFDIVAKAASSPPSVASDRKSRRELARCVGNHLRLLRQDGSSLARSPRKNSTNQ
ncbi:hypothetical protein KFK09_021443 [Dendrobium nobile]|uniref:Uncharacterized protein n=1 Tax=Dendrobium nobile TaxID=94219 RepID=A0A8T3AR58_DENNO|nr:hypothetical protein KFK09_021443 [Dendrobium nobile]